MRLFVLFVCRFSKVLIEKNSQKTLYASNKDERRRTLLETSSSRTSSEQNLRGSQQKLRGNGHASPRPEQRLVQQQTVELGTEERVQVDLYKQKLERDVNSEEDLGIRL